MNSTTYILYGFDELSAEARDKVLNDSRHINVEHEWYESTIEEWSSVLEQSGYETPRILFSGFYSQGDGACFESVINLGTWLTRHNLATKYRHLRKAYSEGEVSGGIKHTGRDYHEYSTDIELDYIGSDDRVTSNLQEVEALIKQDMVTLSKKIYQALEKEYAALTEDEAVADTLRINARLFHSDGCKAHA